MDVELRGRKTCSSEISATANCITTGYLRCCVATGQLVGRDPTFLSKDR
jgi:hypothetical protein